jgi:glycine cleavage system H protein
MLFQDLSVNLNIYDAWNLFLFEVKSLVKVDDYEVPEGLYYTKDWMWVKVEDGRARVGITDYAQKQLNEVVFAELPSVGDEAVKDEPFGTVESVKAVSDLVAPVSGKIEEVNEEVGDSPETLNEDPYKEGWLIVISPTNLEEDLKTLMNFEKAAEWHKELAKKS